MKNSHNIQALFILLFSLFAEHAARAESDGAPAQIQAGTDICLTSPQCMEVVEEAHQAGTKGLLTQALSKYQDAHERWPAHWLLFNLARVLQRLERWDEAAEYYERYLKGGTQESADRLTLAKKHLEKVNEERRKLAERATPPSDPPLAAVIETPGPRKGPSESKSYKKWLLVGGAGALAVSAVIAGVVVGVQSKTIASDVPRYQVF